MSEDYPGLPKYNQEDNDKFAKTESKINYELNDYNPPTLTASEMYYDEKELKRLPDKYAEPKYIKKTETYMVVEPKTAEVIIFPIENKKTDIKAKKIVYDPIEITGNDEMILDEEQVQARIPRQSVVHNFCQESIKRSDTSFEQQKNNNILNNNKSNLYECQKLENHTQNQFNLPINQNYQTHKYQKSEILNRNTNINNIFQNSNYIQNYDLSSKKRGVNNDYSNSKERKVSNNINYNYQFSKTDNNSNLNNVFHQSKNQSSKIFKNQLQQSEKTNNEQSKNEMLIKLYNDSTYQMPQTLQSKEHILNFSQHSNNLGSKKLTDQNISNLKTSIIELNQTIEEKNKIIDEYVEGTIENEQLNENKENLIRKDNIYEDLISENTFLKKENKDLKEKIENYKYMINCKKKNEGNGDSNIIKKDDEEKELIKKQYNELQRKYNELECKFKKLLKNGSNNDEDNKLKNLEEILKNSSLIFRSEGIKRSTIVTNTEEEKSSEEFDKRKLVKGAQKKNNSQDLNIDYPLLQSTKEKCNEFNYKFKNLKSNFTKLLEKTPINEENKSYIEEIKKILNI